MKSVSFPIKLTLTCFAVFVTVFQIISTAIIRKARRTPSNFRLLSLGLIFLDGVFLWFILARVWFANTTISAFIDRMCFAVGAIQFNTISLMTFERYFLFSNHRLFVKYFHPRNNMKIACIFWITLVVLYVVLRVAVCTGVFGELEENGLCYKYSGQVFATISFLTVSASVVCCVRIYLVIREKKRALNSHLTAKGEFKISSVQSFGSRSDDRSSCLVFLYTFSSVMGMIGLAAYFFRAHPGTKDEFFLVALGIMYVSAIMDPFLYVFWFRECRMELLKLCVCCSSRLQNKVDSMRIEIYDIVTAFQSQQSSEITHKSKT